MCVCVCVCAGWRGLYPPYGRMNAHDWGPVEKFLTAHAKVLLRGVAREVDGVIKGESNIDTLKKVGLVVPRVETRTRRLKWL